MIKEIKGNAVDYTLENSNRLLLHCCNAQGVMGSGIAKEIKEKIPSAYTNYKNHHWLGFVSFSDGDRVANLVAQEYYGRDTSKRYISYMYLAQCLETIKLSVLEYKEIVIPKYMCCGLAGGDWLVVLELIEYFLEDFEITIVELV